LGALLCKERKSLALAKETDMTNQVPPAPAGDPATGRENRQETEGNEQMGYRVILVPIDFSQHSKKTVDYAVRFATRYKAIIRLLHVFQVPDYAVTQYEHRQRGSDDLRNQVDVAEEIARENLSAYEDELLSRGIETQAILRVGYPFEEIVLMANDPEIDLVIIGSHGRSRITRLLVGSTAERVVEHAPCPVLVVKERYLG
jgi:universal stress protein A